MIKIPIAFLIYSIFFCALGNTCLRLNSEDQYILNFMPLITEGIFGPIRSTVLLFYYGYYDTMFFYIFDCLTSLHNFFGALVFVYYVDYLIKKNFNRNVVI
jgi:hypothetical protein